MTKRDLFIDKFYLNEYRNYLMEMDKALTTINLYVDNVIQFAEWYKESNMTDFHVEDVTGIDIRDYKAFLQEKDKYTTANTKLASLKNYFSFLAREKLIKKDPTYNINKIKVQGQPQAKSFDEKVYRALRKAIYKEGNPRVIGIWEVLTKTGCRVSELCNLKVSDVDLTNSQLTIYGKGGKYRSLKLHKDAKIAIQDYLFRMRKYSPEGVQYLFVSTKRGKYSRSAIWKIINKYSQHIEHISVHQIRHFVCRSLLRNGVDVATIANLVGHSNPLTLLRYYSTPLDSDKALAVDSLQ